MVESRIEVVKGDITELKVDAIVNAANSTLMGGGGVDGAIHRKGGPELTAECATLNGCSLGDAKITKGHKLPASWVIHTVGPVWNGGSHDEEKALRSCYQRSLTVAKENNIETVAFPAISTGAYRYPLEKATHVALEIADQFLEENDLPKKVVFVCFEDRDLEIFKKVQEERKS